MPCCAVSDSIPTRIALLDRNRRYRYVNREYLSFAGRPADEILGRTVPEVLAEETFGDFYPQGERALAGETVEWAGWLEYRQGRRYVQRICVPLRDAAGAVDGYFIFNRDLTDLKLSEQALAEQLAGRTASERLKAEIIASALDCVIAIDEGGRVVEFNSSKASPTSAIQPTPESNCRNASFSTGGVKQGIKVRILPADLPDAAEVT